MTWAARIEHTAGGLAITFAQPLSRLDMTADVAAHLASLIAIEARQHVGRDRQSAAPDTLLPENMPTQVIGTHPLCCDCEACTNGDHDG